MDETHTSQHGTAEGRSVMQRLLGRRLWRLPVAAAVAVLLGTGGGVAFAYFTATGSGTGTVTVLSVKGIAVEPATATPATDLFPGGTGTLMLKLTNPNSFSLKLVDISQDGPVTATPVTATCASGSGVTVPTESGLSLTVPAGPGQVTVIVPTGAAMAPTSANACQTKSFHIPVTVTVQK
jgi:hypothetical protein